MPAVAYLFAGFFAFAICVFLACLYYARAKRRVKSIEQHIINYQRATKTVAEACDRAFPAK